MQNHRFVSRVGLYGACHYTTINSVRSSTVSIDRRADDVYEAADDLKHTSPCLLQA